MDFYGPKKLVLTDTKDCNCFITLKLENESETKSIRVITKLPNSEQFYKGKVKTHKYINRQNQSTTGKLKYEF